MLRSKGFVRVPNPPQLAVLSYRTVYGCEANRTHSVFNHVTRTNTLNPFNWLSNHTYIFQTVRWIHTKPAKSKSKPKGKETAPEVKEEVKPPTPVKSPFRFVPDLTTRHNVIPLEASTPPKELQYSECSWGCNAENVFHFETTENEQLSVYDGILGQEKAQEQIKLSFYMRPKGYHFYVVGDAGSGRHKIIETLLSYHIASLPKQQLQDHVLLYNPSQPAFPHYITLPQGTAKELSQSFSSLLKKADHSKISALISQLEEQYKEIKELKHFFGEFQRQVTQLQDGAASKLIKQFTPNVLVENSTTEKVPVVWENEPTLENLFGKLRETIKDPNSTWQQYDHQNFESGSLLKADGGFLVINGTFMTDETWEKLMRTLQTKEFKVNLTSPSFTVPIQSPIFTLRNIQVIVLTGTNYEEEFPTDFWKVFRGIELEDSVKLDDNTMIQFAGLVKKFQKEENLLPVHRGAIAKLIEYATRKSGNRFENNNSLTDFPNHITLRIGLLKNLLLQANYWTTIANEPVISRQRMTQAINKSIEWKSTTFEHNLDGFKLNKVLISTEGKVVGQVNGLSSWQESLEEDMWFGIPSRVTAVSTVGKTGVVNIEKEAGLGGGIHHKGILILQGYLRSKYCKNLPLTLEATICSEQSYSEVDGDSGSLAEVLALLSSISGLPLRQDIAVTGSINQYGEVQAIGAVNEKIEGWFEFCKHRGLKGSHGVIIPKGNVDNLVLKEEVVERLKQGHFHIYPVTSVDEAAQILSGVTCGKILNDPRLESNPARYQKGSFNAFVTTALYQMACLEHSFGSEEDEEEEE